MRKGFYTPSILITGIGILLLALLIIIKANLFDVNTRTITIESIVPSEQYVNIHASDGVRIKVTKEQANSLSKGDTIVITKNKSSDLYHIIKE